MSYTVNPRRVATANPRRPYLLALIGALVVLALLTIWMVLDAHSWNRVVANTHWWFPAILGTLGLAIAAAAAAAVISQHRKIGIFAPICGAGIFLAALALVGIYWVTWGYETDRAYAGTVKVTTEPAPTYAQRPAFPIAAASARSNLGETVGEVISPRYVLDGEKATWNSLIVARGTFAGYQAIQEQTIGLTGTTEKVHTCQFNQQAADRRIDGWFSHSLERAIADQSRGTSFEVSDAYGVCAGDKGERPLVIVPLTAYSGWVHGIEVPAGVAVYDGLTGQVSIRTDVTAGQMPGPVYPISLAARSREALAAGNGSFGDYWFGRTGWESTDGEQDDPNATNSSEFSLVTESRPQADYVTPLTPRGGSTSVVAESVVTAGSLRAGVVNPITVHKLAAPRVANSTIAQRIKGDYGDLPEWAASLKIFEITPVSTDVWVVSLGQNQDVNYRVRVKADGSSCLERSDGTKLRCGKATGVGGNGPGVALSPGNSTTTPGTAPGNGTAPATAYQPGADLRTLTDEQLVDLQAKVTREVLARTTRK